MGFSSPDFRIPTPIIRKRCLLFRKLVETASCLTQGRHAPGKWKMKGSELSNRLLPRSLPFATNNARNLHG
jgi:hypothetical protein